MQLGLDQIIRGKTSLILIHTVILFAIKHNKDEFLEKFRTLLSDFSQSLTPDEQNRPVLNIIGAEIKFSERVNKNSRRPCSEA